MTRKHEIFVTDQGRIVYRISNLHTGQQISVRDRSAGEAPITFVDLILEVTHDLDGFVVPPVRLWDERPRFDEVASYYGQGYRGEDFLGHLTPYEDEKLERSM